MFYDNPLTRCVYFNIISTICHAIKSFPTNIHRFSSKPTKKKKKLAFLLNRLNRQVFLQRQQQQSVNRGRGTSYNMTQNFVWTLLKWHLFAGRTILGRNANERNSECCWKRASVGQHVGAKCFRFELGIKLIFCGS